jgi:quercetin dioxygenase-like cupin family protein
MSNFILQKLSDAPRIAAGGDLYRFLAESSQVGGAFALWHSTIPPGGGPPPHLHRREQEAFFVLRGEVTFYVDGQKMVAGPNTFANIPKDVPHRFQNESQEEAEMLILVVPGGLDQMFRETGVLDASAPIPIGPEELQKLGEAAPRYGVEILH